MSMDEAFENKYSIESLEHHTGSKGEVPWVIVLIKIDGEEPPQAQ